MKSKSFLLAACAAAVLAACGGGSSSNDGGTPSAPSQAASGSTLSGTAAGGAPIIGSVFVKDSLGAEKSAIIRADGTYSIDVSGMTGPFMLKAVGTVGSNSVTYYSAATNADLNSTINVTPFTSLIVSNIAAEIAENYYNNGQFASTLSTAALTEAKTNLQQKLAPTLTALGLDASLDLMKASFAADHTGLDAALDLVKVTIDPATNIATLTNALTNAVIGQDNLNSKTDDATPVTLSDAEKAALATAKTDLQKVDDLLRKFEALFATGLPTITQLENSGIFDTSSAFSMSGSSFEQFASDVTTDDSIIGIKFSNSDIIFDASDLNVATVKVVETIKDGGTYKTQFRIARADANSPWKVTGDGRIADIGLNPLAQHTFHPNGTATFSSGLQLTIYPSDYDVNHPTAKITAATVTGPGLPTGGISYAASMTTPYLVLADGGNVIPACTATTGNCVALANTVDNGVYIVKLYSGDTALNGDGYKFTVPKRPVGRSALTAAMFPAITSLTIDGVDLMSASQLQANKTVSVSWTAPSIGWIDFISLYGNGLMEESDLKRTDTSKLIGLGSAPINTTYGGVWLTAKDIYDRSFVTHRVLGQ
ncbi:hypothetical protein GCM10027343_21440 [Noviherbaspirillum agri]